MNNSKLLSIIGSMVTSLVLVSCYDDPNYPTTPKISNVRMEYRQTDRNSNNDGRDSLGITFDFEDNEGDIFLDNSGIEHFFIFEMTDTAISQKGSNIVVATRESFTNIEDLILDSVRLKWLFKGDEEIRTMQFRREASNITYQGHLISDLGEIDSFSCIQTIAQEYVIDNEIFSTDIISSPDGTNDNLIIRYESWDGEKYVGFDPLIEVGQERDVSCPSEFTSSTIPVFDENGPFQNSKEGTVTYFIPSRFLVIPFLNKIFRVCISIKDQVGNVSDEICSEGYAFERINDNPLRYALRVVQ